jgi:hypothetical protein
MRAMGAYRCLNIAGAGEVVGLVLELVKVLV